MRVPTPFPVGPVNVHLIARDPVTLVDAGPLMESSERALRRGLRREGFEVADVKRILLTHGHHDHFGLAPRIARESGASVHGGRDDGRKFNRRWNHRMFLERLTRAGFGPATRLLVLTSVTAVDHYGDSLEDWDPLVGGEVLPGDGYQVRVHATPGHTPGSLSYEVEETGVPSGGNEGSSGPLFTGDTVLEHITPNAVVDEDPERPGRTYPSVARYFETLETMPAGPGQRLLTGHGKPIDDFASHRSKMRRKYTLRERQILRLLRGGPLTIRDLVARMFPGLSPIHVFLAYSEVIGFLTYLAGLGLVEDRRQPSVDLYALTTAGERSEVAAHA